jgi:hypothetical protein
MAPNETAVAAVKRIEEMILQVLRYFRWNRQSDLKRRRRDGESDKAFPLTPPSPSERGRTCERFVNDRGILASIPRIEARPQGSPTTTGTTERPGAFGPSRRAEWFSLSLWERDGVRGKGLVCRLRLSFQPPAPVPIPSKIARNHFAGSNPPGVKGLLRN